MDVGDACTTADGRSGYMMSGSRGELICVADEDMRKAIKHADEVKLRTGEHEAVPDNSAE